MSKNNETFVEFKLANSGDFVHINPAHVLCFNNGKNPKTQEDNVYIQLTDKVFWYVEGDSDEVTKKLQQ